jgi:signal transduction histidine kinase
MGKVRANLSFNLFCSSLKFSPEGSTVKVALNWTTSSRGEKESFDLVSGRKVTLPRAGDVRISVMDTGAGLSEKQLGNLFRSGVQFNSNTLQAGKGSGLVRLFLGVATLSYSPVLL